MNRTSTFSAATRDADALKQKQMNQEAAAAKKILTFQDYSIRRLTMDFGEKLVLTKFSDPPEYLSEVFWSKQMDDLTLRALNYTRAVLRVQHQQRKDLERLQTQPLIDPKTFKFQKRPANEVLKNELSIQETCFKDFGCSYRSFAKLVFGLRLDDSQERYVFEKVYLVVQECLKKAFLEDLILGDKGVEGIDIVLRELNKCFRTSTFAGVKMNKKNTGPELPEVELAGILGKLAEAGSDVPLIQQFHVAPILKEKIWVSEDEEVEGGGDGNGNSERDADNNYGDGEQQGSQTTDSDGQKQSLLNNLPSRPVTSASKSKPSTANSNSSNNTNNSKPTSAQQLSESYVSTDSSSSNNTNSTQVTSTSSPIPSLDLNDAQPVLQTRKPKKSQSQIRKEKQQKLKAELLASPEALAKVPKLSHRREKTLNVNAIRYQRSPLLDYVLPPTPKFVYLAPKGVGAGLNTL